MARPSTYTAALATKICQTIATSEKGLVRLAKAHRWFPTHFTIYKWINEHPEFAAQYARAREDQAHYIVDQAVEIIDDADDKQGSDSNSKISKARAQADIRKWLAARLAPKVYGDMMRLGDPEAKPLSIAGLVERASKDLEEQ